MCRQNSSIDCVRGVVPMAQNPQVVVGEPTGTSVGNMRGEKEVGNINDIIFMAGQYGK